MANERLYSNSVVSSTELSINNRMSEMLSVVMNLMRINVQLLFSCKVLHSNHIQEAQQVSY